MTQSANCLYKASITRESYLFYEMRTTAKLMSEGYLDDEVLSRIIADNSFQYPTEKSVRRMGRACMARLHNMGDDSLIQAIAQQPADVGRQICLYALMKESRLVWDFMITVVGEKFRLKDMSFGKMDLNIFFLRLQEQDDTVATWSDTTITKLKQVIAKLLVDNEYLDNIKAEHLNPVLLNKLLENAIRSNSDEIALSAFNCFE